MYQKQIDKFRYCKIFYLEPVLSDDNQSYGADFDATWLMNWFDIENILKEYGFSIEPVFPQTFEDRIVRIMMLLGPPKSLQSFYTKVRKICVIIGVKKNEATGRTKSLF